MTDKEPLVAICIPSGDELKADFAISLAGISAATKANFSISNVRSSIVAAGRNMLVDLTQTLGATHLMFLDSDMVFPSETVDRLLSYNKDIVGCVYSSRNEPVRILGTTFDGKTVNVESGLHRMAMIPTGCMLINMDVFLRMKKPYFRGRIDEEAGRIIGEDIEFCEKAISLGFEIWCDVELSTRIGHVGQRVFYA